MSIPRLRIHASLIALGLLLGAAAAASAQSLAAPRHFAGLPGLGAAPSALEPTRPVPPALLGRSAAVFCLLGAAALIARSADTEPIARALDGGPLDGVIDIGNGYGSGWTFGGLAVAASLGGHLRGDATLQRFAGDLERSLLASWGAVWVLKLSVDARRPNGGPYSFPSGHTATAFAGATVLSRHYGLRVGLAAYALAGCTALARMEDRRHHLADVLFGAGLGWSLGHLACNRQRNGLAFDHLALTPDSAALCFRF